MRRQFSCLSLALAIVVSLLTVQAGQALAAAPTSAPTILGPANGSSVGSANPPLSWAAVVGAVKYRVQVSTSGAFASTIYSQDTYALQATPPTLLPFSTLYWRVAGMDSSSALGPYSVATFTKSVSSAPSPTTPTNGQTLTFPTDPVIFSWLPVAGATSYTLLVDDASDFVGASTYTTVNTSYTLTDTQTFAQSWWWEVRANYPNAQVTDWSTPWSYQIAWLATPQLRSPANDALGVTETVFSWDPIPGAATYQIQVSPNGDWQNNKTFDVMVDGTRYAPYPTLDNDSYFWRVRARAAGSVANFGPWSSEFQFTRSWPTRPVIVSPRWTSGAPPAVASLELSWTPAAASGAGWVDHASYYEVQISPDLNFSSSNMSCYVNHTTFTPYTAVGTAGEPGGCAIPAGLAIGTTYYWRVRAIDSTQGVLGLWDMTSSGDTQRFIYAPAMPDLSCGPADGDHVSTPVLCWSPVSGASQYQVTIVKNGGAVAVTTTTYGLTYTPTLALTPSDGPFSWHVETIDGLGIHGYRAGFWPTFYLDAPTTGSTLGLLTPVTGNQSIRMPSMTWQPLTGATYYQVFYGPASDSFYVTPLSGGVQLPYAGFTSTDLPLPTGRWYWQVKAFDASGLLGVSEIWYFDLGVAPSGGWIIPWSHYTTPECVAQTDPSILLCTPQVGDTQRLSWQADANAGSYLVYVAKDVNFTTIYRTYKTSQTVLMPRESWLDSQAGKSYYWFVRPCVDWAATHCGPGPDTSAGLQNASAYQKTSPQVSGIYTSTAANPPVTASTRLSRVPWNLS